MENDYDQISAYYYLKYRPPLHEYILKKCLSPKHKFTLGLDVGCGTGQSSVALSNYCHRVVGIEPSIYMFENALKHPKIEYQLLHTENLEFEAHSFDIVSFAGSLYYAKSQRMLDEIVRVCQNNAQIVIYDFEIELEPALKYLTDKSDVLEQERYEHEVDFTGLVSKQVFKKGNHQEVIYIDIMMDDFVALLLSSKRNYKILSSEFGTHQLEKSVKAKLLDASIPYEINTKATMYHTVYEVKK